MKKLSDYYEDDELDLPVLIKEAEERKTKNNKPFLALTFADSSGEIKGMYWDVKTEDVKKFKAGTIVYLLGKKTSYNNLPQVNIKSIVLAEDGKFNILDFVKKSPETKSEMINDLKEYVENIENDRWKQIIKNILNENLNKFFTFPAAKVNHHAMEGGLAYHTLSILRLAKSVSDRYDNINRSLLYAGAILHDLGKVVELSGVEATDYTLAGNLIGHIVIVDEKIVFECQRLGFNLDDEDILLLRHMILAHHGVLEYGSPVVPHLLEAEVLHHLDNLDASIQMISTALENTDSGKFSQPIFGLDRRKFYNPKD